MAVTIGNFTAINDSEVDAESPITESLVTRLRDNAYWVNAGTTKTSESGANKFLETDGSGGVQWTDTSNVGVDGTKGSGTLGASSGSPTQIAEVSNKILAVTCQLIGGTANDRLSVTLYIDQSDSSYVGVFDDTGGSSSSTNSLSGTLTSSFIDITALSSEVLYARVAGGNIEFYEPNTGSGHYSYIWL